MSFYWPHAFWFLLLPLILTSLELRRHRANSANARPKILRAEAGPHQLSLTPDSAAQKPVARLRWRLWLGLALTVVAFARPQWGKLDEPIFDQSREIIIALDLSRSMLSEDVRPSRLERAKLLVSSLLERLRGERVGLVVFSGTAFLQSPLSADYEILLEFLPNLNTRFLPEGGTNYEALLKTALTAFGASSSSDRYLIVLSDGEATDDNWKSQAAELKAKGIRVIGLGVGTAAGAMIPDGSGAFVKDERGAVVLSKLENSTLQQLASETSGVYADASAWVDLPQLLQSTVETGRKGAFMERSRVRLAERFQWVLAPALLLLLWSYWREFPVRPRLHNVKLGPKLTEQNPSAKSETSDLKSESSNLKSEASNLKPEPSNLKSEIQNFKSPHSTPPPLPPASASLLPLLLLTAFTLSLFTSPPAFSGEAPPAPPPAPADALSKLVANYAQRDTLSARDYAELASTTLTYGQRLQSQKSDVPAGPLHDALAAVTAGRAADAKAADWSTHQRNLEALLHKDEPPPKEQPKDQPQQKKPDEKKDQPQQQKQDSSSQNQPDQPKDKPSPEKPEPQKQDQKQNQPQNQNPSQPQNDAQPQPDKQSAFGDMKDKKEPSAEKPPTPPPPADPTEQQQVGGAPEKKSAEESKDPALAVPLQKLDQLKNQDSPVQLYQLMQGQQPTPKKPGKDW